MAGDESVDCDEGRRLGCQTFCCRLLVRLDPDERTELSEGGQRKAFVEKAPDGYCVNLDRGTHMCRIWARRSRVCRAYNCNGDFLLQVAVRHKFNNIVELSRIAAIAYIPKETYVKIRPPKEHG